MNNNKNVALIGAGQIGSRHLQSLITLDIPVSLWVIDPCPESLKIAQNRALEVKAHPNVVVQYCQQLPSELKHFHLAIIATSSVPRFSALNQLLSNHTADHLILEKFLFTTQELFEKATELLRDRLDSVWVNCPRRMYPFHSGLRQYIQQGIPIEFKVTGSDWGLASNSIHFIDLLALLVSDLELAFSPTETNLRQRQSKRAGYLELNGCLAGTLGSNRFIFTSDIAGKSPIQIVIQQGNMTLEINESEKSARIVNDLGQIEEFNIEVPFQSQLTSLVAAKILKDGSCELTPFQDSSILHQKLLSFFESQMEQMGAYVGVVIT